MWMLDSDNPSGTLLLWGYMDIEDFGTVIFFHRTLCSLWYKKRDFFKNRIFFFRTAFYLLTFFIQLWNSRMRGNWPTVILVFSWVEILVKQEVK